MAENNTQKIEGFEESTNRQQFITFTVQGREYGIDIMTIREIKGWTETTSLPNSPEYMRGVINLRGTIVPIMDLRARFNMGTTDARKTHVVMIVNIGERLMGVLVDGVSDILTVHGDEIRPVPDVDGTQHGDIIAGLVCLENRMVALLVLEKLFDKSIEFECTAEALEQVYEAAGQQEEVHAEQVA
jgi:purine-binding chemotaxis protein CheW